MTCRRRLKAVLQPCAAAGDLRMSTCFMPATWGAPTCLQDRPGRINKRGRGARCPGPGKENEMSSGKTTTDHDEIRKWVEKRGGTPTVVKGTEGKDGEGILRIDFAEPDEKLEEIPWDEFFKTFEDRKLAFLHQDKTADGKESRFFKFVKR